MKTLIGILSCFILLLGISSVHAAPDKTIDVIYIVPKDRVVNPQYVAGIRTVVSRVRLWYYSHLNGRTFEVSPECPRIIQSEQSASYFTDNKVGDGVNNTFFNVYNELNRVLGNTPADHGRLIYIDAPGPTGAGDLNFAVLPEHDMKALLAEPKGDYDFPGVAGGHAHEIGHLLGLDHAGESDKQALMQYGYITFPNCYLTAKDRKRLEETGYIHRAAPITDAEVLVYEGGSFVHLKGKAWEERKASDGLLIAFKEERRDDNFAYLLDAGRNLSLALPLRDGRCYWKTPDQKDWVPLYEVKR